MKTTKEQKKQIIELKEKGKTRREIADRLKLSFHTVYYYTSDKKNKIIGRTKKYRKEKPEYSKKEKEYQKKYHREKYKSDKKYRNYLKEKNRENQRKRYLEDEEYREKKLEQGRLRYLRKKGGN